MDISNMTVNVEAVFTALDRKRRHSGMSRQEVARTLGVTPQSFSLWGQGNKRMSADTVLRACLWLNVPVTDFAVERPDNELAAAGEA